MRRFKPRVQLRKIRARGKGKVSKQGRANPIWASLWELKDPFTIFFQDFLTFLENCMSCGSIPSWASSWVRQGPQRHLRYLEAMVIVESEMLTVPCRVKGWWLLWRFVAATGSINVRVCHESIPKGGMIFQYKCLFLMCIARWAQEGICGSKSSSPQNGNISGGSTVPVSGEGWFWGPSWL